MSTWLITGSNRGLGLELTRQLLERGHGVVATCRRPDAADDLRRLEEAHADDLAIVELDVSSADGIEAAFETVRTDHASLDVLVNNAGVAGTYAAGIRDLDDEEVGHVLDVNVVGPVRVTQQFLPLLRAGDGRKVVNVSSLMGSMADNGTGGAYAYRMSKAALNMLAVNLDRELRGEGFTAFAIHPGWVQTDMGGANAPLEIPEAIPPIIDVVERATPSELGGTFFYPYEDRELPW